MIRIEQKGSFEGLERALKKSMGDNYRNVLEKYAQYGVQALSAATPIDTGLTATSWGYSIEKTQKGISIIWTNDNVQNGVNIAVILQYGHATRNGGWVEGIDYINPALKPIFDSLAKAAWKEVTGS